MWAVMSSEKSRSPATAIKVSKSRHNSRTKLRMKLLYVQKRDNVEFYLCCKFQLSPFSVRRKTDVKDGKIAPQVLMPRGKYQLAGIHKFINALTTHSELLSHPPIGGGSGGARWAVAPPIILL